MVPKNSGTRIVLRETFDQHHSLDSFDAQINVIDASCCISVILLIIDLPSPIHGSTIAYLIVHYLRFEDYVPMDEPIYYY